MHLCLLLFNFNPNPGIYWIFVISKEITSFVLCLVAPELPVLTRTRSASRAAKERSRETDRNFGLCRGSEGHSELELYKSASRTVWRICRRVDLADFGVLGRGRADADIPAIDSNLSAISSAPDVLKPLEINPVSYIYIFINKYFCSSKSRIKSQRCKTTDYCSFVCFKKYNFTNRKILFELSILKRVFECLPGFCLHF